MEFINGGITAPKGFMANGLHCGIRKNKLKKDLALIYSSEPCVTSALYTQNKVKGAPLVVTKNNLHNNIARAVICNSGNANTCNFDGIEKAEAMCTMVAEQLNIDKSDVVVASTGVIGQVLNLEPIKNSIKELAQGLAVDGSDSCAEAIMTTDTIKKEIAISFTIDGKRCNIGAIAKGSGMIHPNMATMLCFVTTDVNISASLLNFALKKVADSTINMVSVDGDTSTNDMVVVMANGCAENKIIDSQNESYAIFEEALNIALTAMAKKLAKDGEGATKLVESIVSGAGSLLMARVVAKSVITSSLLKTALFASDANWGRILCAIGYADIEFNISCVDVVLASCAGQIAVCKSGSGVEFDESIAHNILNQQEVQILINLNQGSYSAVAYGCDLTYDYVKINADYRS